ncbi:MAG: hypothetical protein SV422_09215, partial [Pseudomonadota bacterium]|nr:hypothetical protein [Pseudomonadota bacterium]
MPRDYWLTIVQLIGVVQCTFIACALLYLPGSHRHASRWLSGLFGTWALMFGYMALRQNDLEHLAPVVAFLRLPLFFLCGPLLYLYLRQVSCVGRQVDLRDAALHLVPFVVVLLAYLPSIALGHDDLLAMLYSRELRQDGAGRAIQLWLLTITRFVLQLFVLHLLTYVVLCLRVLVQHKRRVLQHFSRLDKVSLDWMRNLLIVLVLLWISAACSQILFANTAIGR